MSIKKSKILCLVFGVMLGATLFVSSGLEFVGDCYLVHVAYIYGSVLQIRW